MRVHEAQDGLIPDLGDDFAVFVSLYALHRQTDLEGQWAQVRRSLRAGGTILAQEYVGPARFEWSTAQCEVANRALRELPAELRPHHSEVGPALAETLRTTEPGLAERSDQLISSCQAGGFQIVAQVGCGCALLHPVLTGQAQAFSTTDWSHSKWLAQLFQAEDELMQRGELGDDFAMFIAQPS